MKHQPLSALLLLVTFALTGPLALPAHGSAVRDSADPPSKVTTRVDVNTAGIEELKTLPGIGPALATRIVKYRGEHGRFGAVDELLAVKGIGPRLLTRLRPLVTVSPAKKKAPGTKGS